MAPANQSSSNSVSYVSTSITVTATSEDNQYTQKIESLEVVRLAPDPDNSNAPTGSPLGNGFEAVSAIASNQFKLNSTVKSNDFHPLCMASALKEIQLSMSSLYHHVITCDLSKSRNVYCI